MLTDDPGTPAAGHTEFNLAITLERRPHVQAWMLPELDYNYGFTDRLQVNFLTSYNVRNERDHGPFGGLGSLSSALKWRFLDQGPHGFSASLEPRVDHTFVNASVRRGLSVDGTPVLLPVEIARDFGAIAVDLETGVLIQDIGRSGCVYGIVGSFQTGANTTLFAELHGNARLNLSNDRLTINFGLRQAWTRHVAFLFSLGHDVRAPAKDTLALVSYCGLQFQF